MGGVAKGAKRPVLGCNVGRPAPKLQREKAGKQALDRNLGGQRRAYSANRVIGIGWPSLGLAPTSEVTP